MCKYNLCFSAYVSSFDKQKPMLSANANNNSYVFASFHISEEFNDEYTKKATSMCRWLKENGFKIIGDVSLKTLSVFDYTSITDFAEKMGIDVLRLDYGFSEEETAEISKKYPVALNASTINSESAKKIISSGGKVFAMHNFYPRPETGLDKNVLKSKNNELSTLNIEPLAFIPCDLIKRGPIFDGLPTLEEHRYLPPYCGFIDLCLNYNVTNIFAADICMSPFQIGLIRSFCDTNIIAIPANLHKGYEWLYSKEFTIRIDSPSCSFRLEESREYSCTGEAQEPFNCSERTVGSITIDNTYYSRYSGEVQIIRKPLPIDARVNVIGSVQKEYLSLVTIIKNGCKIKLIN